VNTYRSSWPVCAPQFVICKLLLFIIYTLRVAAQIAAYIILLCWAKRAAVLYLVLVSVIYWLYLVVSISITIIYIYLSCLSVLSFLSLHTHIHTQYTYLHTHHTLALTGLARRPCPLPVKWYTYIQYTHK